MTLNWDAASRSCSAMMTSLTKRQLFITSVWCFLSDLSLWFSFALGDERYSVFLECHRGTGITVLCS